MCRTRDLSLSLALLVSFSHLALVRRGVKRSATSALALRQNPRAPAALNVPFIIPFRVNSFIIWIICTPTFSRLRSENDTLEKLSFDRKLPDAGETEWKRSNSRLYLLERIYQHINIIRLRIIEFTIVLVSSFPSWMTKWIRAIVACQNISPGIAVQ